MVFVGYRIKLLLTRSLVDFLKLLELKFSPQNRKFRVEIVL